MGLSPREYDRLTLRDLDLKYEGWQEKQKAERFDSWERTRLLCFYSLASNPYSKPPKSLDKLFKNPYSERKKVASKKWTAEEILERRERLRGLRYEEMKPEDYRRAEG